MKRAVSGIAATASAVLLLATVFVGARTFVVADFFSCSNWTAEPLAPALRAQGAARGQSLNFTARGSAWILLITRGLVIVERQLSLNAISRWDEAFEQSYVNHPQRTHQAVKPPPHGKFGNGILAWLGFGWSDAPMPSARAGRWVTVQVPLWSVALAEAVLPGIWVRRALRQRRRKRRGLCLACGYDLRGSAGRCPECGAEGVGKENQRSPAAQAR